MLNVLIFSVNLQPLKLACLSYLFLIALFVLLRSYLNLIFGISYRLYLGFASLCLLELY